MKDFEDKMVPINSHEMYLLLYQIVCVAQFGILCHTAASL
jgi:hypothetical protein